MEIHILQSLEFLTFEGIPKGGPGGIEVDDFIRLATDHTISRELIDKRYKDAISHMEAEELTSRNSFLFALTKLEEPKCSELLGRTITRNSLVRSQLFLQSLWLLRDNSGNSGTAYFTVFDDDGTPHWLAERHSAYYFTAECTLNPSTFSREDLDRALALHKQLDAAIPKVNRALDAPRPIGILHASRLARCLYFTQAARSADDASVKAAFYCICLETLFSTDISGVSHRVAERVAVFLGEGGFEQRAIYKDIHDLYGYRSTVVHGSPLKEKDEAKLRPLVVLGDAYLRRTILKILETPQLLELFSKNDPDSVREHFLERLFPTT